MDLTRHIDGNYTIDGAPGYYSVTRRPGGWSHIHYCIPKPDGIGLSRNEFVGNACEGNFGDSQVPPTPNREYISQVESKIREHAHSSHE